MEITQQKKGTVVIIRLKGRLDSNTSNSLQEKLLEIIDIGEKLLALDCTRLDYISSAGLRVLLMGLKKVDSVSGKIALFNMKPHIKEVFDLAGFTELFSIFQNQEDALEAVAKE